MPPLESLVKIIGMAGLFFIIFAESGLFFGFFFPGDSLLFTAGFLASQGFLNIYVLVPLMVLAAILGDSAGYFSGNKFTAWIQNKKDTFFFKKIYIKKAEVFYKLHGGKTLILARFIPGVRTFAPIVAGMAKMKYSKFLKFNIFGGLLWGAGVPLLGFFIGKSIPNADQILLPIIGVIILISILPAILHRR